MWRCGGGNNTVSHVIRWKNMRALHFTTRIHMHSKLSTQSTIAQQNGNRMETQTEIKYRQNATQQCLIMGASASLPLSLFVCLFYRVVTISLAINVRTQFVPLHLTTVRYVSLSQRRSCVCVCIREQYVLPAHFFCVLYVYLFACYFVIIVAHLLDFSVFFNLRPFYQLARSNREIS